METTYTFIRKIPINTNYDVINSMLSNMFDVLLISHNIPYTNISPDQYSELLHPLEEERSAIINDILSLLKEIELLVKINILPPGQSPLSSVFISNNKLIVNITI